MTEPELYKSLNNYLRRIFGQRVQKIPIDAGFTCPNRDGKISNRGCIYCNAYGSGTGALSRNLSIPDQVRTAKAFLGRRYGVSKFIAYFQAFSNTYGLPQELKAKYDQALKDKDIIGLAIGTRPDCVSEDILSLISSYKRDYKVWMEYGLQSAHDRTLKLINRGHTVADFADAVRLTNKFGIDICAHIILGLPGEVRRDMLETAAFVSDLGIHGLKIHALYVVKGSEMEKQFAGGLYRPLSQAEYVDLVCDVLEIISPEMVIHRITGDPRPEELLAPLWVRGKSATINAIKANFLKRNSFQGSKMKRNGI